MTACERKEYWACLALRHTRGIGPRSWKRLLEHYGSALAALEAASAWPGNGLLGESQTAAFRTEAWRERAREEWDRVKATPVSILLWTDARYPALLRELADPPLFLYYAGDADLLANPCVAVVGARRCSRYGMQAADSIAGGLSAAGVTVVSGLANGIDRRAHLAGLSGCGGSIAVLGAGLDVRYPVGNSDVRARLNSEGLVLTEYPPGTRVDPRHFPMRNRIMSGVSLGVVVIEAEEKSGALVTASRALEQNREVFAVPGSIHAATSSGCHRLINQGARLACSAEDVLTELAPLLQAVLGKEEGGRIGSARICGTPARGTATAARKSRDGAREDTSSKPCPAKAPAADQTRLSAAEEALLAALCRDEPTHIDDLSQRLGWETAKVSRTLLGLEMSGLVRQRPGMLYSHAEG